MAYTLLNGLKVIEISAFVAAPLAGLTLAQLGAEVIRIDPVGGGIDHGRWPLSANGTSLYWSGLNRAKKSICLDLKSSHGQDVLGTLLARGDGNGGILLTNLTGPDWLSYETLTGHRSDLVMVDLKGHHDGKPAVDYTVNSAVGVPFATGPEETEGPVNHMLPAWDAVAGLSLATAILAAVRARDTTGEGQHLSVALSDVAYAFMGNLGVMADTELTGTTRPRLGNDLYGAFGTDLPTSDGRYVMVVAITTRQWQSLLTASGTTGAMAEREVKLGLDFTTDEGRFNGRKAIAEELRAWSSQLTFDQAVSALESERALWGPYQTFGQMMADDPRASTRNPMIQRIEHPGVGPYRMPGSAIRNTREDEGELNAPPTIGQDTEAVLRDAGLSDDMVKAALDRLAMGK